MYAVALVARWLRCFNDSVMPAPSGGCGAGAMPLLGQLGSEKE